MATQVNPRLRIIVDDTFVNKIREKTLQAQFKNKGLVSPILFECFHGPAQGNKGGIKIAKQSAGAKRHTVRAHLVTLLFFF